MKVIYSSLTLFLFVSSVSAQFKAGQKLLGPTFSIAANSNSYEANYQNVNPNDNENSKKTFGFGVGLVLLKLKTENVGYGWGINYNYNNWKNKSTSNIVPPYEENLSNANYHELSLLFFRRTFYPLASKFNFYYDAGIRVNAHTENQEHTYANGAPTPSTITSTESESKGYGAFVYVTPGFTYTAKKNLLLEAALNSAFSIGYSHTDGTTKQYPSLAESKNKDSDFSLSSSLIANSLLNNITFSVKWIL